MSASTPPLVVIESPFAPSNGRSQRDHVRYAQQAMRESLMRGEAPYASHLLYTQPGVLDDSSPDERNMGIDCGLLWGQHAAYAVAYLDYGVSHGMAHGIYTMLKRQRRVYARLILDKHGSPHGKRREHDFQIHGIEAYLDRAKTRCANLTPITTADRSMISTSNLEPRYAACADIL